MKILIIGSTGFLGRTLKEALEARGETVVEASTKNCDATNESSFDIFSAISFDHIYHLAAWTQPGDFCIKHQAEQWIINQKINTNVLSWWSKHQRQAKLIAMGSSCAYDPSFPLNEEFYLQGRPIETFFSYGMTKKMLLAGLISFQKQWGLNYLYFIPSTLYGPHYHTEEGRQLHFIFDLIRKILRGSLYDEPVILWGDGEQKRELVYIKDCVETMISLSQTHNNLMINIGGGKEYSIKEFAEKICQVVGYPHGKIQYDLSKYVGARSKILSIEKLRSFLPINPTPLDVGLNETISWFRNTMV